MAEHCSVRIERMSSLETEPRTLMFQHIQDAREEALYVMSTKTIEEAISIFTEGLQYQPVLLVTRNKEECIVDDIWNLEQLANEHDGSTEPKDIVSAPF